MLTILGFFAEWVLFTFSLYQAVVEISEQKTAIDSLKQTSKKYPDVSPLYWLFPPLKVWLEKKRAEKILHDITIETKNFDELFSLFNRAIAWAYISAAEIFIAVQSTEDVLEIMKLELSNWVFAGVNLLLLSFCILIVVFRTSDFIKRRIYKRYIEEE